MEKVAEKSMEGPHIFRPANKATPPPANPRAASKQKKDASHLMVEFSINLESSQESSGQVMPG